MPYVKSNQVYRCPSEFATNAVSYLANNYVGLQNLSVVASPSTVILMTDGNNSGNVSTKLPTDTTTGNGLNEDYSLYCQTYRIANSDHHTPRHLSRENFLFCDGHVKTSPAIPEVDHPTAAQIEAVIPFNTYVSIPGVTYTGSCTSWQ